MKLDAAKSLDTAGWHKFASALKYETRNLIDGSFVDSQSGKRFAAINPVNNLPLAEVSRSGAADVDAAVTALQAVVTDLAAAVTKIQAEIAALGTPVNTAALDAAVISLQAVQATVDALEPAPPVPPAA